MVCTISSIGCCSLTLPLAVCRVLDTKPMLSFAARPAYYVENEKVFINKNRSLEVRNTYKYSTMVVCPQSSEIYTEYRNAPPVIQNGRKNNYTIDVSTHDCLKEFPPIIGF